MQANSLVYVGIALQENNSAESLRNRSKLMTFLKDDGLDKDDEGVGLPVTSKSASCIREIKSIPKYDKNITFKGGRSISEVKNISKHVRCPRIYVPINSECPSMANSQNMPQETNIYNPDFKSPGFTKNSGNSANKDTFYDNLREREPKSLYKETYNLHRENMQTNGAPVTPPNSPVTSRANFNSDKSSNFKDKNGNVGNTEQSAEKFECVTNKTMESGESSEVSATSTAEPSPQCCDQVVENIPPYHAVSGHSENETQEFQPPVTNMEVGVSDTLSPATNDFKNLMPTSSIRSTRRKRSYIQSDFYIKAEIKTLCLGNEVTKILQRQFMHLATANLGSARFLQKSNNHLEATSEDQLSFSFSCDSLFVPEQGGISNNAGLPSDNQGQPPDPAPAVEPVKYTNLRPSVHAMLRSKSSVDAPIPKHSENDDIKPWDLSHQLVPLDLSKGRSREATWEGTSSVKSNIKNKFGYRKDDSALRGRFLQDKSEIVADSGEKCQQNAQSDLLHRKNDCYKKNLSKADLYNTRRQRPKTQIPKFSKPNRDPRSQGEAAITDKKPVKSNYHSPNLATHNSKTRFHDEKDVAERKGKVKPVSSAHSSILSQKSSRSTVKGRARSYRASSKSRRRSASSDRRSVTVCDSGQSQKPKTSRRKMSVLRSRESSPRTKHSVLHASRNVMPMTGRYNKTVNKKNRDNTSKTIREPNNVEIKQCGGKTVVSKDIVVGEKTVVSKDIVVGEETANNESDLSKDNEIQLKNDQLEVHDSTMSKRDICNSEKPDVSSDDCKPEQTVITSTSPPSDAFKIKTETESSTNQMGDIVQGLLAHLYSKHKQTINADDGEALSAQKRIDKLKDYFLEGKPESSLENGHQSRPPDTKTSTVSPSKGETKEIKIKEIVKELHNQLEKRQVAEDSVNTKCSTTKVTTAVKTRPYMAFTSSRAGCICAKPPLESTKQKTRSNDTSSFRVPSRRNQAPKWSGAGLHSFTCGQSSPPRESMVDALELPFDVSGGDTHQCKELSMQNDETKESIESELASSDCGETSTATDAVPSNQLQPSSDLQGLIRDKINELSLYSQLLDGIPLTRAAETILENVSSTQNTKGERFVTMTERLCTHERKTESILEFVKRKNHQSQEPGKLRGTNSSRFSSGHVNAVINKHEAKVPQIQVDRAGLDKILHHNDQSRETGQGGSRRVMANGTNYSPQQKATRLHVDLKQPQVPTNKLRELNRTKPSHDLPTSHEHESIDDNNMDHPIEDNIVDHNKKICQQRGYFDSMCINSVDNESLQETKNRKIKQALQNVAGCTKVRGRASLDSIMSDYTGVDNSPSQSPTRSGAHCQKTKEEMELELAVLEFCAKHFPQDNIADTTVAASKTTNAKFQLSDTTSVLETITVNESKGAPFLANPNPLGEHFGGNEDEKCPTPIVTQEILTKDACGNTMKQQRDVDRSIYSKTKGHSTEEYTDTTTVLTNDAKMKAAETCVSNFRGQNKPQDSFNAFGTALKTAHVQYKPSESKAALQNTFLARSREMSFQEQMYRNRITDSQESRNDLEGVTQNQRSLCIEHEKVNPGQNEEQFSPAVKARGPYNAISALTRAKTFAEFQHKTVDQVKKSEILQDSTVRNQSITVTNFQELRRRHVVKEWLRPHQSNIDVGDLEPNQSTLSKEYQRGKIGQKNEQLTKPENFTTSLIEKLSINKSKRILRSPESKPLYNTYLLGKSFRESEDEERSVQYSVQDKGLKNEPCGDIVSSQPGEYLSACFNTEEQSSKSSIDNTKSYAEDITDMCKTNNVASNFSTYSLKKDSHEDTLNRFSKPPFKERPNDDTRNSSKQMNSLSSPASKDHLLSPTLGVLKHSIHQFPFPNHQQTSFHASGATGDLIGTVSTVSEECSLELTNTPGQWGTLIPQVTGRDNSTCHLEPSHNRSRSELDLNRGVASKRSNSALDLRINVASKRSDSALDLRINVASKKSMSALDLRIPSKRGETQNLQLTKEIGPPSNNEHATRSANGSRTSIDSLLPVNYCSSISVDSLSSSDVPVVSHDKIISSEQNKGGLFANFRYRRLSAHNAAKFDPRNMIFENDHSGGNRTHYDLLGRMRKQAWDTNKGNSFLSKTEAMPVEIEAMQHETEEMPIESEAMPSETVKMPSEIGTMSIEISLPIATSQTCANYATRGMTSIRLNNHRSLTSPSLSPVSADKIHPGKEQAQFTSQYTTVMAAENHNEANGAEIEKDLALNSGLKMENKHSPSSGVQTVCAYQTQIVTLPAPAAVPIFGLNDVGMEETNSDSSDSTVSLSACDLYEKCKSCDDVYFAGAMPTTCEAHMHNSLQDDQSRILKPLPNVCSQTSQNESFHSCSSRVDP